jgi:hypothetical protein
MIFYDFKAFHYIAIFATLIATSTWYFTDLRGSKTMRAFHVFGTLTGILSGYYLSHRLAYTFGPKLPNWLITKYIIWGVIGFILPLLSNIKPQHNKWYFGINIFLFASMALLAIYKPF